MSNQNKGPAFLAFAAFAVVLAVVIGVYVSFFTPEKRTARAHLNEADEKCKAAIEPRLNPVRDLFDRGCDRSKLFAEDATSLAGKWNSLLGLVDGRSDKEYLARVFAERVLSPQELKDAVEGAVRGYLLDVEGIEAEMLVKLRADLAGFGDTLPHLETDDAFTHEYRRLLASVANDLRVDLGVNVAGVVVGEVISTLATQAAAAAAAEVGVTMTVFGSATAASMGVGVIASLVANFIVEQVLDLLGYNAAAEIEKAVHQSVWNMWDAMLRKDGGWLSSQKAGSLRAKLEQLHESRSKVRREAINQFLKGGAK